MKERVLAISRKSESEARPSLSWSIFFIVMSTRSLRIGCYFCVLFVVWCRFVFFFQPYALLLFWCPAFSFFYFSNLTPSSCSSEPAPSNPCTKRQFFIRLSISSLFNRRNYSIISSLSSASLLLFNCSSIQLFNYFFNISANLPFLTKEVSFNRAHFFRTICRSESIHLLMKPSPFRS